MRQTFGAVVIAVVSVACTQSRDAINTAKTAVVDSARIAVKTDSAASASSSEQCVRGEPEPALQPAVKAVFQRTAKLEATEDARVADTLSLLIRLGGCVHFSEVYAFTVGGAANNTAESQRWLR